MCTVPPPPPPPPPPPLVRERASPGHGSPGRAASPGQGSHGRAADAVPDGVCEWARGEPELRLACARAQLCPQAAPRRVRYSRAPGVLQRGPTCGLAALAMLARLQLSPDAALAAAQARGYSRRGEMFSCRDMAALAAELLPAAGLPHARVQLETAPLYSEETVDRLLAGAMMLVPYDSDHDHRPALLGGRRAHWALLVGVVAPAGGAGAGAGAHVLARHGKSRHVAAWRLRALADSNANLAAAGPARGAEGWVLPPGGLAGPAGLAGRYIVVEGI
ncbi:UPF0692 protein CG33108 isoform X2 [Plutella xylostella]|uniref:UPF0692 protein CG33108 isoform X2 n=1 Tax=Plutella xylostella TaxID=51655 RepID=UPI002032CB13|nr:UPF0692 protein CG33108 isoform X2 [Plutella xylostella]